MNGSNFSAAPNFDNLLIQSLMGRLKIRPSAQSLSFSADKSLEDLLFSDMLLNLSDSESDTDKIVDSSSSKTRLSREESKLEKEIIRTILSGEIKKLNPNSGQAVTISGHHICVGFHEETGSDYKVWEWHGHIMLFDEENGYTPEYIYGNYFEKVSAANRQMKKNKGSENINKNETEEKEKENVVNGGLKELIDIIETVPNRILHRSLNAISESPRFA